MKKIIAVLSCLLIILCVIGCNDILTTTENETTKDTSEDNRMEEEFFDKNFIHKPTKDDISKVHKGMSFYEIVDIIGKPHSFADYVSHGMSYKWVTVEGDAYTIMFLPEDAVTGASKMSLSEYHKYTVAINEPQIVVAIPDLDN